MDERRYYDTRISAFFMNEIYGPKINAAEQPQEDGVKGGLLKMPFFGAGHSDALCLNNKKRH